MKSHWYRHWCLVIHLGRWRCIESRPPKRAGVKTAELSYGRPWAMFLPLITVSWNTSVVGNLGQLKTMRSCYPPKTFTFVKKEHFVKPLLRNVNRLTPVSSNVDPAALSSSGHRPPPQPSLRYLNCLPVILLKWQSTASSGLLDEVGSVKSYFCVYVYKLKTYTLYFV